MGWVSEDEKNTKETKKTSNILLGSIICLIILIMLIVVALFVININKFSLIINGTPKENYNKNNLLAYIDGKTYINIENFSKLVGYEYHDGEYKAFTIEDDKCYVQGTKETTSFYLNENKIFKLPIDELTSEYNEIKIDDPIKKINKKLYATVDVIKIAFNVFIDEKENEINIYTLDELVKTYNSNVLKWGYTDITNQEYENLKTLLYGYLIVNKKDGLYKIIDLNNTKELVTDKYSSILFYESSKEFFVTNSLGQVGIINLDGTTKIEPIYSSIEIIDKRDDLYLVEKDGKYGVVKSGNSIVINTEYDDIGIENILVNNEKNAGNDNNKNNDNNMNSDIDKKKQAVKEKKNKKYIILDSLIPVCKLGKWGAFDKEGKEVINLQYDGIGCDVTIPKINETVENIKPVITIERCNGIVVKNGEKFGLIDKDGKVLIKTQLDSIYEKDNQSDEENRYYMLYNNKEINLIERLIEAGLIEKSETEKENENENQNLNNTINNNTINNNTNINNQSNNISNTQITNTIENNI